MRFWILPIVFIIVDFINEGSGLLLTPRAFVEYQPQSRWVTTCTLKNMDVVLLVDGSGSIDSQSFENMKQFLKLVVDDVDVEGGSQVAVLQFDDNMTPLYKLGQYDNKDSMKTAIVGMTQTGGGTMIAGALKYVKDVELPAYTTSQNTKYILLMTDGKSGDDPSGIAEQLRNDGHQVFAIGITEGADEKQLKQITGSDDAVLIIGQFGDLGSLKMALKMLLCKAVITGRAPSTWDSPAATAPAPQPVAPPVSPSVPAAFQCPDKHPANMCRVFHKSGACLKNQQVAQEWCPATCGNPGTCQPPTPVAPAPTQNLSKGKLIKAALATAAASALNHLADKITKKITGSGVTMDQGYQNPQGYPSPQGFQNQQGYQDPSQGYQNPTQGYQNPAQQGYQNPVPQGYAPPPQTAIKNLQELYPQYPPQHNPNAPHHQRHVQHKTFNCHKAISAGLCYSPDVCRHCRSQCMNLGYCN